MSKAFRPRSLASYFAWGCGGLVALGLLASILLPMLAEEQARNSRLERRCVSNLKQMNLSMQMYANENRGDFYPPLSPLLGRLAMDSVAIHPEYMPDPYVHMCPLDRDQERAPQADYGTPESIDFYFDDKSYF